MTLVSDADELITADSVDGAIQQVMSAGGQQVITIVTDSIQLGNLQTGTGISQPIIVTMPDGQQGEREAAHISTKIWRNKERVCVCVCVFAQLSQSVCVCVCV